MTKSLTIADWVRGMSVSRKFFHLYVGGFYICVRFYIFHNVSEILSWSSYLYVIICMFQCKSEIWNYPMIRFLCVGLTGIIQSFNRYYTILVKFSISQKHDSSRPPDQFDSMRSILYLINSRWWNSTSRKL